MLPGRRRRLAARLVLVGMSLVRTPLRKMQPYEAGLLRCVFFNKVVLVECMAMKLLVLLLAANLQAQITTPKQALGFNLGDDYRIANYTHLEAYWRKLSS